jgi:hypothetical protein
LEYLLSEALRLLDVVVRPRTHKLFKSVHGVASVRILETIYTSELVRKVTLGGRFSKSAQV